MALLERIGHTGDQAQQQFLLDILAPRAYEAKGEEGSRLLERIEGLLSSNAALRIDLASLAFVRVWPRISFLAGLSIANWDNGAAITVSGKAV